MKNLALTTLLILISQLMFAQINAITETGDEVVLYQDGTWKYINDSLFENTEIPLNEKEFEKDKKATFLVKSKKLNIGIYMNSKIWNFSKAIDNDAAEFQFQNKGEDLYAMLISEKVQIPIETLKGIALNNAKKAAPDIKIIKEEYRIVNGIKVLMMQMTGTVQGLKFSYYGYYYSNTNGTIQFMAFTGENLMDDYITEVETFLNGLVEL